MAISEPSSSPPQKPIDLDELSPEYVTSLLEGVERYNPRHLELLESYVQLQCSNADKYDLNANLAVLKLYQFNPSSVSLETINLILTKSLTALPETDFTLYTYLLNESLMQEPSLLQLSYFHSLLEEADFSTFWAKLSEIQEFTSQVDGFEDSIRRFITSLLPRTYRVISTSLLQTLLGFAQEKELTDYIQHTYPDWTIKSDQIELPSNKYFALMNEKGKDTVRPEKVHFDQLTKIIASCDNVF